jgi:hypothetical protein
MFLTLSEATQRIRKAQNKPPIVSESYASTFMYDHIKTGFIKIAQPDALYIRTPNGEYIQLGDDAKLCTMVTEQSVTDYIEMRKYTPRIRQRIIAYFQSDGTSSEFSTMLSAQKFFGINYAKLYSAIKMNACIEFAVSKQRLDQLGIGDSDIENITECVKFKRV